MNRNSILATVLLGASMLAAQAVELHDDEDFEQPGVLQFHGIGEHDQVRVDGELVPSKGLARVNYNLMVAPGEYVISVRLAGSAKECVASVKVAAGTTVQSPCVRQTPAAVAD